MAKKTREQRRTEAAVKRVQKRSAYEVLVAKDLTLQELTLLTIKNIQEIVGKGFSATYLENIRDQIIQERKQIELQSAADWITSLIMSVHPNVVIKTKRNRQLLVYLNGMPEEI